MALVAENISKSFSSEPVLQEVDFTMEAGEVVALVGPSGTGKSTFLRILNQLELPDSGRLAIGETVLFSTDDTGETRYASRSQRKVYTNNMGMVFQDHQLFPNMTTLENCIEAPVAQKRYTREEAIEKAKTLLNQMNLLDKTDAFPRTLSGGQQQRVAIARAMMLNPLFLCFDEPTSALDQESANDVGKLIEELASEGMGILIVTHDLNFAERFSTRMVSSDAFLKR